MYHHRWSAVHFFVTETWADLILLPSFPALDFMRVCVYLVDKNALREANGKFKREKNWTINHHSKMYQKQLQIAGMIKTQEYQKNRIRWVYLMFKMFWLNEKVFAQCHKTRGTLCDQRIVLYRWFATTKRAFSLITTHHSYVQNKRAFGEDQGHVHLEKDSPLGTVFRSVGSQAMFPLIFVRLCVQKYWLCSFWSKVTFLCTTQW